LKCWKRNTVIIEAYKSTDLWMCLSCSHCFYWLYETVFWNFSDSQICGLSDERYLSVLQCALQPTVDFGLSNNILSFFPICHQLSPSSLNLSSFFLCSTSITISFYCVGLLAPCQTPNLEDQGIPFGLGSSPLTRRAWEALPVADATASRALGIMWPHKPHHSVKVGIPSGGI
jgi:hypothetical protein